MRKVTLICQGCGKPIEPYEKAIIVSYGYIAKSGRFYNRYGADCFHRGCEKAFRDPNDEKVR